MRTFLFGTLLFLTALGQNSYGQTQLGFAEEAVWGDRIYGELQFAAPLRTDDHTALQAAGIRLLEYRGDRTYTASLPKSMDKRTVVDLGGIRLTPHRAKEDFLSPLQKRNLPEYALDGDRIRLVLQYHKDIAQASVLTALQALGATVEQANGRNNFIAVSIAEDGAKRLLNQPYTSALTLIGPPSTPDDRPGRNLHRVNRLNRETAGLNGITGAGVNILVRDDGALFEHIDFKGRMDQMFVEESRGDHGDGVAGIFTGAGNLDPLNTGMAYGAFMYVVDYQANFLDETMDLHLMDDVLITNSSYSDGCNAGYTNRTAIVDQQMFDNPTLLHVFSAGNEGEMDCGYGAGEKWGNVTGGHKIGKNVIAVANLNSTGVVASSSSRGPAFDGRIKPDISANGLNHVSTVEDYDYAPFGGTSAAAPVVAGIATLLYEAYEQKFGQRPPAALIKAILLNTANDLGRKGPDFIHGWGLANAHRAARVIAEDRFLTGTLAAEEVKTHDFEIPAGIKQVKIMTYWPDPEGVVSEKRHLINDVNTTLIKDVDVFFPYILNSSPDAALLNLPATRGEDHLNNMEQIAIDDPAPGTYRLKVSGDEIPFGAVDYFVVVEMIGEDIEITFPNGGENLERRTRENIHWEAGGDEGEFDLIVINEAGDTLARESVPGDRRLYPFLFPNVTDTKVRLVIAREGQADTSDGFFIVSSFPSDLEILREDGFNALSWEGVDSAVSYQIHLLGDQYMEKKAVTDTTYFVIPDAREYKVNWIAVSALFADGSEGLRSRAIPVRPEPIAQVSNNMVGKPCVDHVVIFSTESLDTLTNYEWDFGQHADPEKAFTAGPHEVVYSRRGTKLGYLKVSHEGGSDSEIFAIDVQPAPDIKGVFAENLGNGEFQFRADFANIDSLSWDFGDGNKSTGNDILYTYGDQGIYTVTLTGYSRCGNVVRTVEVEVTLSSVEETEGTSGFVLRSNPVSDVVEVLNRGHIGQKARIVVVNAAGQVVADEERTSLDAEVRIPVNQLPAGTYQIRITTAETEWSDRLIKM